MVIREKEAREDNRKTKAPELNWVETGLVDEEEEYRMFGGYLPAEVHSRNNSNFKTVGQPTAQRVGNVQWEKAFGYFLYKNIRDEGAGMPSCIPVPSNQLEEQKLCVELLDILV
ncbi:hypothetical protein ACIQZM_20470 [Peribacillus sp. NPDC097206]|uniref:hypothetical protein n=1 Tax=Peribacillus sp. NPDC097206 TaxID=3364398 RepID=UPI003808B2C2